MENIVLSEHLRSGAEKKGSYDGLDVNDYTANGELLVTVTLREYRALVKADAALSSARMSVYQASEEMKKTQSDLEAANQRAAELTENCEKLMDENDRLVARINSLREVGK